MDGPPPEDYAGDYWLCLKALSGRLVVLGGALGGGTLEVNGKAVSEEVLWHAPFACPPP